MIHVAETTVGRRYAGWFIRNTEHAHRVLDTLRATPLPVPPPKAPSNVSGGGPIALANDANPTKTATAAAGGPKPGNAWGAARKVEVAA